MGERDVEDLGWNVAVALELENEAIVKVLPGTRDFGAGLTDG